MKNGFLCELKLSGYKREMITETLAQRLRTQILSGELKVNDPIMSLSKLSALHQVSRGTAEKAVNLLVSEGLVEKKHGRGNFVSPMAAKANRQGELRTKVESRQVQIGLSFPTSVTSIPFLSEIKIYALNRGALLTTFDVSANEQDPEHEKRFIECMVESGTRGLAIYATPVHPNNEALFKTLRQKGIKVALLSPPSDDVNDQVMFLPDYQKVGRLAVEALANVGVEQVVSVHTRHRPTFFKWIQEGVFTTSQDRGMTMAPPLKMVGYQRGERMDREQIVQRNQHLFEQISRMPAKTGIVCRNVEDLELFESLVQRHHAQPEQISLVSTSSWSFTVKPKLYPCVEEDHLGLLKACVDYLLDDAIPSDFLFHRKFEPQLVFLKLK